MSEVEKKEKKKLVFAQKVTLVFFSSPFQLLCPRHHQNKKTNLEP